MVLILFAFPVIFFQMFWIFTVIRLPKFFRIAWAFWVLISLWIWRVIYVFPQEDWRSAKLLDNRVLVIVRQVEIAIVADDGFFDGALTEILLIEHLHALG